MVIHQKLDLVLAPLDGVIVPFGHIETFGEEELVHQRGFARIAGAVQCHADPVFLSDIFHDVDFAGFRPFAIAEQPESGPDADIGRHFDARFCAPVGEVELALSFDPSGYERGITILVWINARAKNGA